MILLKECFILLSGLENFLSDITMSSELSKQDYLKRYLEGDDKEKKRKRKTKSSKSVLPKVKIVHENIDIRSIKFGNKEDTDEEECPVVAEVVDDRPIEIKSKEIYESSRWKRLGDDQSEGTFENHGKRTKLLSPSNSKRPPLKPTRHDSDSDVSPDRNPKLSSMSEEKHSNSTKENQHTKSGISSHKKLSNKQQRHDSDSDLSPARPPTQISTNYDSDLSPVRPKRQKSMHSNSDSDLSPPRPNQRTNSGSDLSPARRPDKRSHSSRRNSDSDLSPKRKRKPCQNDDDSDLSPPRKSNLSGRDSKSKDHRPDKTLSGLKAGLQNAATLREETKEFKMREKSRIEQLDDELSGRNAGTIVRDKRTGQKRNLEEEEHADDEKKKKISEQQQKYEKWGKGLVQGISKDKKLADELYEASKPFARYCDDEDLEEQLKSEIHDEDPMAQYMRKKKQKHTTSLYPAYSGPPPPPNRFGILPGYRWDGVDRSNGFEKKYFESKSSKKAKEEEAYLWSVQDM